MKNKSAKIERGDSLWHVTIESADTGSRLYAPDWKPGERSLHVFPTLKEAIAFAESFLSL